jgi:hypothetical protein
MRELAVIVATRPVLVTIGTLRTVVAFLAVLSPVLVGLRAIANPESCQKAGAYADEQPDESLRDWAYTSEREPTGADGMLDVLHDITDDVVNLRARERARPEARHVAGTRADRFPDHRLGHAVQRRRLDPVRERVAGSCDGVAGRAVEREQAKAYGHIRMRDVKADGDPRIVE